MKCLYDHYRSTYIVVAGSYHYDPINDLISLELLRRDGKDAASENPGKIRKIIEEANYKSSEPMPLLDGQFVEIEMEFLTYY